MSAKKIYVKGISDELGQYICEFMKNMPPNPAGGIFVPILSLIHQSIYYDENGRETSRKGPGFVLGAISELELDDELILHVGGMKLAFRIPKNDHFLGEYYLHIQDGNIVNKSRNDQQF